MKFPGGLKCKDRWIGSLAHPKKHSPDVLPPNHLGSYRLAVNSREACSFRFVVFMVYVVNASD